MHHSAGDRIDRRGLRQNSCPPSRNWQADPENDLWISAACIEHNLPPAAVDSHFDAVEAWRAIRSEKRWGPAFRQNVGPVIGPGDGANAGTVNGELRPKMHGMPIALGARWDRPWALHPGRAQFTASDKKCTMPIIKARPELCLVGAPNLAAQEPNRDALVLRARSVGDSVDDFLNHPIDTTPRSGILSYVGCR
jgi:hypothetical protein